MLSEKVTDTIIQLLIIGVFLIVLMYKNDVILSISVIILVSSIILFVHLNANTLEKWKAKLSPLKEKTILIIISQALFFILVMGIIQSSVYFYFNYANGYFESILLLIGLVAIFQNFDKYQITQEITKSSLFVFEVFFIAYMTIYEYSLFFDSTLLAINSLNPFNFVQGLVLTIPTNFIQHLLFVLKYKGIFETVFIHGLFIIITTSLNIFVVSKIVAIAKIETDPSQIFKIFIQRVSKTPFILVIIYLSVLQLANGLDEFLQTTLWILCILFILVSVICIIISNAIELKSFQINMLIWILLIGFLITSQQQFAKQTLIFQDVIGLIVANRMMSQILSFILLNTLFFIAIYYLLTRSTAKRQNLILLYSNFIILVVLASYIDNVVVKFIIVGLTVFFVAIKENSINLKEKNDRQILTTKKINFGYIRKKIVLLSIFSIAFLLL